MNYGNTTAASIIIALTEAWEKGKIKENDLVVLQLLEQDSHGDLLL